MGIFPGSFYHLHRNGSGNYGSYQWYVAATDMKLANSNCLDLKSMLTFSTPLYQDQLISFAGGGIGLSFPTLIKNLYEIFSRFKHSHPVRLQMQSQ